MFKYQQLLKQFINKQHWKQNKLLERNIMGGMKKSERMENLKIISKTESLE